jgi:hypothetical protein
MGYELPDDLKKEIRHCGDVHLSRPAFSCVNVTAVFALKKVYGCSGFETSNCFPKLEFASTTPARSRIDTGRLRSDLLIGCHAAYVGRRT